MDCGNCKKCDTATDEYCDRTNCEDCCPNMQQKHKTNADRIRAMSDEELADFISNCGCPDHAQNCRASCADCTLKWLKQPAEGVGE